MEVSEILEQYEGCKEFLRNGGITVTGGEPLLQIDFLIELFTACKERKIHTCIDTSGVVYQPGNKVLQEKLDQLMSLTDLVLLDIKHIDSVKHKELTGADNSGILAFLKYLNDRNIPVWIRHVVVPGITLNDKDLFELGYFLGQFKNIKALDALPYHTMGTAKYESLNIPFALEGVAPATKEEAIHARTEILKGMRKRIKG